MVVCGEKEGPLEPNYKYVGGILFSDDSVSFDLYLTKMMGFDYSKFPVLVNALSDKKLFAFEKDDIKLRSNFKNFANWINDKSNSFNFEPTSGWKGYL